MGEASGFGTSVFIPVIICLLHLFQLLNHSPQNKILCRNPKCKANESKQLLESCPPGHCVPRETLGKQAMADF